MAQGAADPSQATRVVSTSTISGASTGMEIPNGLERRGSYKLVFERARPRSKWSHSIKIYTKTGDSGETGLSDGSRVAKHSLRVAAMGAVDECNSAIGIARLDAEDEMDAMLGRIQNDLFDLGADLSMPEEARKSEGALRIKVPRSKGWSGRLTP